jgi:DNA-directed RNA polymerase specialized sigma24 family protein
VDRLRERYRRGPPWPVHDGNALGAPAPPPERAAEDAELAEQLRAALARLPARQA